MTEKHADGNHQVEPPQRPIPRPAWLDLPHSEWPPEARTLFTILDNIVEAA